MKLFDTIDGLLVGTKYLAWGIALVGIIGSAILFFANLSMGLGAAMVFVAAFLLSVGVTLLLLPKKIAKGKLESNKRFAVGGVAVVLAVIVMGITYYANGGFPTMNLLFI